MTFKEILDKVVEESDTYRSVLGLMYDAEGIDDAEQVDDEVTYEGRWSSGHRTIFAHDGRFWAVEYDRPATENQEWTTDGYECYEVTPVEKVVISYTKVK